MTEHTELPEDRVNAYLDVIDEHDRHSRLQYGENVHEYNNVPLARADLRDVLRELKSWRDRANELEAKVEEVRSYTAAHRFDIHMGAVEDMLAEEGDAEQGEPITAEND